MITIQDLKDSREEIIEMLTETLGAENVKEGMTIIAKTIGFRGLDHVTDPVYFAKQAISLDGIADRLIVSKGAAASRRLEEINIEASKKLMKHI